MPLVYLPKFIKDIDYQVLNWLDKHGNKSEITFEFLDDLDHPIKHLEYSFRRLSKEGLILMIMDGSAIISIELTFHGQNFLAEHILGQTTVKRK